MLVACTLQPAASRKEIIGTWRLLSMTHRNQITGKEEDLWGTGPIGLLTYTPGGRMSAVIAAASRPMSADSAEQASGAEQAMLFRSSFAYAGTYSVTATCVMHHVEVASDPAWMGKDQTRFARVEGSRLIITGPPLQTVGEPDPKVLQLVWEKIE